MKAIEKLFNEENALDYNEKTESLFFDAVKETFEHHYKSCEIYRKICENDNFKPDNLKTMEDVPHIPWIMVNVFKWYHLTSVDENLIVKRFTSSGTTGQSSHIAWDEASFKRQTIMREKIIKSYGLSSDEPVNYLCFTYSPELADTKGAPYAHNMYTSFAPANKKFFAIHPDKYGKQVFDEDECIDILKEFEKDGLPLRIVGFPAFAWRTIKRMKELDIKLSFPDNSLIIFAGGWKSMADEAISQEEFAEYVEKYLDIPRSSIRDIYGFVEHGVPYVTCEKGHFHVPVYSRAFVRKPGSLELLNEGERGLLHVITPYNWAQPNLSVLSTDYAVIKSNCGCGLKSPYIMLQGRAGVKKHQGCAITATELLKK